MLDLNRSLVLWQRFDGISGGTYLQDNSTWNNSFVNTTNGGFSSFEQQGFGTSFTPNDTSKGIKGPNNSIVGLTLNNGKNFTVTFWANMSRRAAGDNWATAFAISPSGGYGNPRLWVRKLVGVIGVELINSTGQGETIDYVYLNLPSEQYKLNDSTWHFYAAKFMRESTDSSNMTVYTFRDGANPMNNKSVLGINFGGNFSIGSFSGGTFPFNDTLDEFMIFDRGLSNAEIQALYNGSNYAQNFTDNFSGGNYTLQGYVVNTSGAMNTTGLINFNFTKTSGGAPAAFVPAFQVNISKPLNNTDYTYGYNFTLNVSVWGNATGYNASYSFDGLANVTLGNIANGSANFTVLGILAAGLHNITVYAQNGTVVNQSYANFSVAKYTQWANLTLGGSEANRTITYETTNTATGSGSNVTGTLYRDGVAITDPDTNQIYGNATYNFTYVTEGNANYTLASKTWFLKVNKAVPTLTISLVPSSGVYGTPANATGSGCTSLYSQLTCQVNHKDETDVTYNTQANAVNQTYAVGVHTLNYTTAGNANYTSASSSNAQITITQYTQWANLTLGGSEANRTITFGTTNTASGSASNVTGTLYRDGTSISNPDTDQVYGNGTYNFTYVTAGNRNYSSAFKTWFLKVNKYDQWCNVTINTVEGNVTIWEGTQSTATGSASNVTGTLYRNTSSVSNPDVQTLANATYNYTYVSAGNTNYTACSKTWYLFVNAAPFSPAFIVNITHPVNNTAYDCGGSFTAYFNITGNASTYDTKYSFDGAANVSSGNVANNSNTSINLGVLIAGLHNLTVFGTNGTVTNFTYANFSINTCTGDNPPSFGACTFISPIQMGMLNNYSVPITDDNGVSACIWSFNYGGTFANETAIAAGSATSYQCNITKAFPFPSNVSIKVYANDTAGQWNFSCVTEVHVIPSGPDVNPYGIIAIGMAGMSLSYWAYRKSRQG